MNSSRLDSLKRFLEEDPGDPFNWYALALETRHTNDEQAVQLFEEILTRFPHYIPVYYQAAKAYEEAGNQAKAEHILTKGIEIATAAGDQKTARELMSALSALD